MKNSKFVGFSLIFLAVILFATNANAATFRVINTNDAGAGSLRQAITSANGTAVIDTIEFDIPGSGVKTIAPLTVLPTITQPLIIDGTTQTGWSVGNLVIEIDGSNLSGTTARGLFFNSIPNSAAQSFVRGLIINRFLGAGIYIETASNITIEGCVLGTDANTVEDRGNARGIDLNAGGTLENIIIGGNIAAERNIISGNSLGINTSGGNSIFITGNYIGTNKNGTIALPNSSGIQMLSSFCTIGGATAAEGNVISGNTNVGIILSNSQNTVSNNFIGTAADGIAPLGNGSSGMRVINAFNSLTGGHHLISNNIIANNSRQGISFFPSFIPTIGNNISANSIYNNGVVFFGQNLGIDLDNDFITPNDAGDADSGTNNLQNFPVLTSVTVATTTTNILGTLNSEASTSYRIEFFANLTDKREGKTFLGFQNVTTNASGDAAINATFSVIVFHGQFVTATATRNVVPLDTSEFSAPIAATVQTFVVTNTNNSGTGSLRQAITDANANVNPNLITFAITPLDGSVKTISLTSPLPTITNPLGIDGLTQNSATCDMPKVELNGTSAGAGGDGFTVTADNFLLQGLVINRFLGDGIILDSNNTNIIRCNKIGTNASGNVDLGNGANGIFLDTSSLNLIERNTFSGNGASGIRGSFAQFNTIQGNIIGLSSDGATVLPNVQGGIVLLGGVSNIIGGTNSAKRNVVSGNGIAGIFLSNSASNSVKGNYIGVNASGSGTTFGNTGAGIALSTSFADDNIIGGTENGAGNVIAFNTTQGISLASTTGTGNRILSNLIHDNGSLGIDINADGVTANDSGDTDFGANNQQNFPVISAAETFFGGLKITGTLNSTANTSFRIELFANPTCDASGNGEGRIFVGAIDVTTDNSGNASFSQTFAATVALGETVSATATRNSTPFDTSEFSLCRTVTTLTSFPTLTVTNTNDSGTGSLRQVITDANLSVSPDRIVFNISGGGVKTIIPLGALPSITSPVVIDGLSQPGATCANPLIVLNGVSAGAFGNGFIINATAEITGLVINNFNANAIQFNGGGGNILKCNRIGTDATGLNSVPNGSGVLFQNASNNIVGGTNGDGNLITNGIAIRFENSNNNTIQGNILVLLCQIRFTDERQFLARDNGR